MYVRVCVCVHLHCSLRVWACVCETWDVRSSRTSRGWEKRCQRKWGSHLSLSYLRALACPCHPAVTRWVKTDSSSKTGDQVCVTRTFTPTCPWGLWVDKSKRRLWETKVLISDEESMSSGNIIIIQEFLITYFVPLFSFLTITGVGGI